MSKSNPAYCFYPQSISLEVLGVLASGFEAIVQSSAENEFSCNIPTNRYVYIYIYIYIYIYK